MKFMKTKMKFYITLWTINLWAKIQTWRMLMNIWSGEYISKDIQQLFCETVILRQLPPHRHLNKMVESTCNMLQNAKLSHKYWAKALSMATYVIKNFPNKSKKGPNRFGVRKSLYYIYVRIFKCKTYNRFQIKRGKNWIPKGMNVSFWG